MHYFCAAEMIKVHGIQNCHSTLTIPERNYPSNGSSLHSCIYNSTIPLLCREASDARSDARKLLDAPVHLGQKLRVSGVCMCVCVCACACACACVCVCVCVCVAGWVCYCMCVRACVHMCVCLMCTHYLCVDLYLTS